MLFRFLKTDSLPYDDWEIDINLNTLWREVLELYRIISGIGLHWTDKNSAEHVVSFIDLFFGAWLVYEILDVFFKFNWHNKDEARDDVWDD